ncbi:MAG: hypothetical protein FJ011_21340 [Chloroflexi bacterium]|nr:hypothetical protein [Chloroflexota bacterium]
MGELSGLTWPVILAFSNLILSSAIVITAFSLLGYMLTRNLRSRVGQTFSILLACVLIVFAGDVVITRVESYAAAVIWLRVQWIGIAMVPAAYLHFSDALLQTTRHASRRRRAVVILSYLFSSATVLLALFTDMMVFGGVFAPPVSQLSAGSLFLVFVAYFVATAAYGAYNVVRARRRCLTPASRRRMTYLALSFAAPGLGVFPYLVDSGLAHHVGPIPVLLLAMTANVAVGAMLVVMAYSVAYYGVLTPDRVVKHDMVHYLLRGPVVGTLVLGVMLVIPRVELILGLPRDTALIFAVVSVIVLGQLAISAGKPWLDRLIFRQDREEITWIQALDRRLLTSSDLSQFLDNVLTGLCELLRVDTGFVLVRTDAGLQIETLAGDAEAVRRYAQSPAAQAAWQKLDQPRSDGETESTGEAPQFCADTDFWYCPLRSQDGAKLLGVLAVAARSARVIMAEDERGEANMLLAQAAAAIADRYVQEGVFATLQRILPDLERIQEWRSALLFAPPPALPDDAGRVKEIDAGEGSWQQWVKDALSHYWGGPKLTESPLAGLRLVRRSLRNHDGNLTRALRAILQEAIERQRPVGERKMTASEWLLYNILEMRFIQGHRVRDIARRLAMSESDLYRKQRAAVAEVAKTLAEMEAAATTEEN